MGRVRLCLSFAFHLCLFFNYAHSQVVSHGDSWAPDYILRATAENYTIACASRYSVIVNGTSPGPIITLKENQTSWIRVYNDMTDLNFTMVRVGVGRINRTDKILDSIGTV